MREESLLGAAMLMSVIIYNSIVTTLLSPTPDRENPPNTV
jgi:hypothetical protein